jgi:hypothetical protein
LKESTRQMLFMYENEGRSLQEIATQFNMSRQSIHLRLKRVGYTPRPDSRSRGHCNESVVYNGVRFFKSKKGGWRTSSHPRLTLAREIWADHHGEIPEFAMIYTKVQGSTNINDYYMKTKEERCLILSELGKPHQKKPMAEGTLRNTKMGEVVKYGKGWVKKERYEYLKSGGALEAGQMVYNGEALEKGEMFSVIRNQTPRELTKEGALLYQIKKQIKKRESNEN